MKVFKCRCGQAVYFDSDQCISCGAALGFDPLTMDMVSVEPGTDGVSRDREGAAFRRCANGQDYGVCNWLLPASSAHSLCLACQLNRTIPDLSVPGNVSRWRRLEQSKKRLIYTLLRLQLPLVSGHEDAERGLLFDFVEDARSDPGRWPESFVTTGYLSGVITINVLEADDVVREATRTALNEPYRTVLGHMRHESGHYYMPWVIDFTTTERFRDVFGDESEDYSQALASYYANGPAPDWRSRCISAYASAHPAEDWAETWGHYLHIVDILETAQDHGLIHAEQGNWDFHGRLRLLRSLTVTLNELNRSVGLGDAYPFVINSGAETKLSFVDESVVALRRRAE